MAISEMAVIKDLGIKLGKLHLNRWSATVLASHRKQPMSLKTSVY